MTNDKPDKLEALIQELFDGYGTDCPLGFVPDYPWIRIDSDHEDELKSMLFKAMRAQQTSLPSYEEFSNAWEACQGRVCPLLSLYDYLVDNTKPKPPVSDAELFAIAEKYDACKHDHFDELDDEQNAFAIGWRAAEKHHGVGGEK